jgi:hypothetical protein
MIIICGKKKRKETGNDLGVVQAESKPLSSSSYWFLVLINGVNLGKILTVLFLF